MARYIIRLDDACPTLSMANWGLCEEILNEFSIKPIVAVIPNNIDMDLKIDDPDPNFWDKVRRWQLNGWQIALHGFDHGYISVCSGIHPVNITSEFAGVDIEIQKRKISDGLNIFTRHGIETNIWIAPSHTFDENTLCALKAVSSIRIVSDSFAFYPYTKFGFLWIPQQLWRPKTKKFGVWTICLHPNMMRDNDFDELRKFCRENVKSFVADVGLLISEYSQRKISMFDRVYSVVISFEFKVKQNYLYKFLKRGYFLALERVRL
jgi:predicted deacetylase